MTTTSGGRATTPSVVTGRAWGMLALATIGFGVNFWAWALISPLGPAYRDDLGLTSFQQAFLVAVPVIVGSLGRIPIGALTDRLGARAMFPAVSLATIAPVLFVGYLGDSYWRLILGGFFLGLGGTTFAVGVPFASAWFPPERRGLALGIFGVGMGGTAISAFTTVKLAEANGRSFPFLLVAAVLAAYGVLAAVLLRDAPGRTVARGSLLGRTWSTLRIPTTRQASFLYAVGFGGFVAFSVYLPTYLKNAYGLSQSDAAARTAGFVVLAVIARPLGGWLSDRLHPVPVLVTCFVVVTVLAAVAALELDLVPWATIAFLGMAAALGAAAGACFALVARVAPPDKVGSVTGIVGAAGGLGGFFPPLGMGTVYGARDSYRLGVVLLALTTLAAALYTRVIARVA
jgi:NNP family nitrate/nitrite transporter-like MFS transporter